MKVLLALSGVFFCSSCCISLAEERNISEEINSLVNLCQSRTSIHIDGNLEGGLRRFFGSIIEGNGELSYEDGRYEFLNMFSTDAAKLEAQRIFNACAIDGMDRIYGKRKDEGNREGASITQNNEVSIKEHQVSEIVDITNKTVQIERIITDKENGFYSFGFKVDRKCNLQTELVSSSGSARLVYRLLVDSSSVYKSGTYYPKKVEEIEILEGSYVMELRVRSGAGGFSVTIGSICKEE